jgi:hypothetical protein
MSRKEYEKIWIKKTRVKDENVWLTQKLIAKLFDVHIATVNEHLKNIFSAKELEENSVIRKFLITASDGKNYNTKHYNLETIISLGYRINSDWATKLNAFLKFNEKDILENLGKVTAEISKNFAESEFEKYRPIQNKLFESDFDKEIKKLFKGRKDITLK